jgi:hypothetical protein
MPIWNDDKLREVVRDKASTRTECLLAEALLTQREISRALEAKLDPTLKAKCKMLELQIEEAKKALDAMLQEAFISRSENRIFDGAVLRSHEKTLVALCKLSLKEGQ